MRRPLDWIVVSISIMVLFANRMLAPKPAELVGEAPEIRAEVSAIPVAVQASAQAENPFAYIREDGSLQFLPAAATPRVANKPTRSRQSTPSTALYTWSSPIVLLDKDAPSFQ